MKATIPLSDGIALNDFVVHGGTDPCLQTGGEPRKDSSLNEKAILNLIQCGAVKFGQLNVCAGVDTSMDVHMERRR